MLAFPKNSEQLTNHENVRRCNGNLICLKCNKMLCRQSVATSHEGFMMTYHLPWEKLLSHATRASKLSHATMISLNGMKTTQHGQGFF